MPPFDALAALRNLRSPVNVSAALGPFAGPEGRSMSASEGNSLDAVRNSAAEALGAGPAFHGLTQALDREKFAHTTEELNARDDLSSGLPSQVALGEAGVHNKVADVNSEAGFGRETLPFALQARDRAVAAENAHANLQYVLPAQLKAQGDVGAAQASAKGQTDIENLRQKSLSMRGLMEAINALVAKTGKPPTADDIGHLQTLYGGLK